MNMLAHPATQAATPLARLAGLLQAHAPADGSFELGAPGVPGVHAIRASRPSTDLVHGLQGSSVCIIAQGAKTMLLGGEAYTYDASRMLIFSVDLPVAAQVLKASPARPYLCFRLDLDPQRVAALTLKVYPDGPPRAREQRALYLAQAGGAIRGCAAGAAGHR
jgi:hypothetical protein